MKFLHSKLFWFICGLVVLACILMVLSAALGKPSPVSNLLGAAVTPLQRGLSGVGDFFSDILGYFYRYDSLKAENEQLRRRVSEYQALESEYNAAISENEALRELASLLKRRRDFQCELCEITSYMTTRWADGFTVNRGSASGIEAGDSVITSEGLVGHVSAVGLNWAQVETIAALDSSIAAMVSRTRETVVAEGSYDLYEDGLLRLSYLTNDSRIREGDLIETSGYGGTYPKGLAIGRVTEIRPESHGMSSYAIVEPCVDLSAITSVFIVKDYEIVE